MSHFVEQGQSAREPETRLFDAAGNIGGVISDTVEETGVTIEKTR